MTTKEQATELVKQLCDLNKDLKVIYINESHISTFDMLFFYKIGFKEKISAINELLESVDNNIKYIKDLEDHKEIFIAVYLPNKK